MLENTDQNIQETNTLTNKDLSQRNADHQATDNNVDQIVQRPINDPTKYNEIINIPSLRKRNQSKSKIEVHCSVSSGPISPYTVFLKHMHNLLIDANQELTFSQRSVLIANLWAMMSEKDKEPFKYSANMVNSNTPDL